MELIAVKNGNAFVFYEQENPKWKIELLRSFWGQKIGLVDLQTNEITTLISKKLKFIINGETVINFTKRRSDSVLRIPFKFFKSQIEFEYKNCFYEFIEHSDLVYSIFKDGHQVGMYKKQHLTFLNKDGLLLRFNKETDIELIISIISIADLDFYSTESAISVNLGNLIVSKKQFDKKWRPN